MIVPMTEAQPSMLMIEKKIIAATFLGEVSGSSAWRNFK